MKKENLMRAASAAKQLGVKRQTIYYHLEKGNLKAVDIDGVTYIDGNQVAKLKVRRKGALKPEEGKSSLREVYQESILPLGEGERLRVAAFILEDLAQHWKGDQISAEERAAARRRLREFAGSVASGTSNGSDNEKIDSDLAEEYLDTHEDDD